MKLYKQNIETPLGEMITYASDKGICFLDFSNRKNFNNQVDQLIKILDGEINERTNSHIEFLRTELIKYFNSELQTFSVPIHMTGTDFQIKVWPELLKIPFGKTISYKQQAVNIKSPTSVRAVANANGKNKLAIIIPCHRVIGTNGLLTGYAGGIERKHFLLDFENNNTIKFK